MLQTSTNVFGLFELDAAGTVKYSKLDTGNSSDGLPQTLVGLNFFDAVAPFGNAEELRRRFSFFAKGTDSAHKFTFPSPDGEIKVMLTQISEREFDGREKMIIVDIRKML